MSAGRLQTNERTNERNYLLDEGGEGGGECSSWLVSDMTSIFNKGRIKTKPISRFLNVLSRAFSNRTFYINQTF